VAGTLRPAKALLATLALAAPGCAGSWFRQGETRDIVLTHVVVDTDPPGATVAFNGIRMERAPVRIPVEYDHVTEHYARQSNYGLRMREATGTLGTILLFPVWLPASLFQVRELKRRHVYGGNRHTVTATADAHRDAAQEIILEGEEEVLVTLRLAPIAK